MEGKREIRKSLFTGYKFDSSNPNSIRIFNQQGVGNAFACIITNILLDIFEKRREKPDFCVF